MDLDNGVGPQPDWYHNIAAHPGPGADRIAATPAQAQDHLKQLADDIRRLPTFDGTFSTSS
jgi:hypothetical protein